MFPKQNFCKISIFIPLIFSTFNFGFMNHQPANDQYHSNQNPEESTSEILRIQQVSFKSPMILENSANAIITIQYEINLNDPPKFLNVFANTVLPPIGAVSVAQNILLPPFQSPVKLSFWIDLSLLGVVQGMDMGDISLVLIESDTIYRTQPTPSPESFNTHPVENIDYNVGNGIHMSTFMPMPLPPFQYDWKSVRYDNTNIDMIYRGCEVPNIDLDDSRHPSDVFNSGYAGDKGACVPAACANSFGWLERMHPDKIDTQLNDREKLETLSVLMGQMPDIGVTSREIIKGKLDFIDLTKIPVSVKFQAIGITENSIAASDAAYGHSAENHGLSLNNSDAYKNRVSWEWILDEMKNGEAVELTIETVDKTGTTKEAHMVSLTGIGHCIDSGEMIYRWIYFKDDADQSQLNPDAVIETYAFIDTIPGGFLRVLDSYTTHNDSTADLITAAYSESYDPTVTFDTGIFESTSLKRCNYQLDQNCPNPFNAVTIISYYLPKSESVYLCIYNTEGQLIQTLLNENQGKGIHSVEWDAKNISSGIYFYKITAGNFSSARKLLLLK